MRFLVVGKRIFLLTAEARSEDAAKALAAPLFASFEVLPEFARRAAVKAPPWGRFTIPDGNCSVLMPGEPAVETGKGPKDLGEGRMRTYTGYHPEQALVLLAGCVELPPAVRKQLSPEEILDKGAEKGGRKINLGQYPGREWHSAKDSKPRTVMRT